MQLAGVAASPVKVIVAGGHKEAAITYSVGAPRSRRFCIGVLGRSPQNGFPNACSGILAKECFCVIKGLAALQFNDAELDPALVVWLIHFGSKKIEGAIDPRHTSHLTPGRSPTSAMKRKAAAKRVKGERYGARPVRGVGD
jgi:hypothetical protein